MNWKKAGRGVLLTVLVVAAVYGLITIAKFIGYVALEGEAGKITELEILFTEDQGAYGGIAGVAIQEEDFTGTQSVVLQGNSIEKENLIFQCLNPDGEQEVYASTEPESNMSLDSVSAATTSEINNQFELNGSHITSADNTYTNTLDIVFDGTTISAPGLYTLDNNGDTSNFTTIALKDGDGRVFFGSILTNFSTCFDGDTCNFQYMLPVYNETNQTYYFWNDPGATCPSGQTGGSALGNVTGNVTDNSGNTLEDVIIDVAGRTTLSNSEGNYNLTTIVGTHNIYAIKEGYLTYQDNVTVNASNTTIHNIVMAEKREPSPFTGFGSGVDEEGTAQEEGSGSGTGQGPGQAPPQPIVEEPTQVEGRDFVIDQRRISKKLRKGNFLQESIKFYSFQEDTAEVNLAVTGNVTDLLKMDKNQLLIESQSNKEVTLTFFGKGELGTYNGTLVVSGDMNATIPITIELIDEKKQSVQALVMDVETTQNQYVGSEEMKFQVNLRNMLSSEGYPVELFFSIQSEDGNETLWTDTSNVFLRTSFSLVKKLQLPTGVNPDDYILRVTANYRGLSSGDSTIFQVVVPWYNRIIFGGVRIWMVLLGLLLIAAGGGAYYYIRKRIEAKKRYHLDVDFSTMPDPGPRSIYVGNIAEQDKKMYMDMEKFKTHTIVAGSTGGGKSITGQVIIEEMLQKDVAVVVFDPTAQWSGMLRKLEDEQTKQLYDMFDLDENDAQAFNGNIREVKNPKQIIKAMDYASPGEITVFACHKLEPRELDIVVANAIRSVFRDTPEESKPLKVMFVFDEVHRLLPKFGGSGDGFLQVERACREFRKWGIGVMLISQVLSDFMGEIKANINTEIQMRTRDEGDLERIRQKYGEEVLRSLTMATVGTGMVENPSYNNGRPFFVSFRPPLHSLERLSDEEIEKYDEYNEKIDQLEYELEQLDEKDVDVFDLKLELNLAKDKVKTGDFTIVDTYVDGLKPRIKKKWDDIGEEPEELEKKTISEEELRRIRQKAQQEREEYVDEQENTPSEEEGESGPPGWDEEVPPSKKLELANDMIVISMQQLYDEIKAMDDDTFEEHVDEEKNDFADWIEDSIEDEELANHLRFAETKEEILELLEKRKEDEELPELSDEQKEKLEEKEAFEEFSEPPEDSGEEAQEESEGEQPEEQEKEEGEPEEESKVEKPGEEGKEESEESTEESEKEVEESKEEQEEKDEVEKSAQETDEDEGGGEGEEISEKPEEEGPEDIEKPEDESEQDVEEPEESTVEDEVREEAADSDLEQLVAESPEEYFRFDNGEEIKSVKELKDYLKEMPEDTFRKHVGEDYNHFADWIEGVFHRDDLAQDIRNIQDKNRMAEAL